MSDSGASNSRTYKIYPTPPHPFIYGKTCRPKLILGHHHNTKERGNSSPPLPLHLLTSVFCLSLHAQPRSKRGGEGMQLMQLKKPFVAFPHLGQQGRKEDLVRGEGAEMVVCAPSRILSRRRRRRRQGCQAKRGLKNDP